MSENESPESQLEQLADSSVRSLDELFDADPSSITDTELDSLVDLMRQARKRWQEEEESAKRSGRRANHTKGLSLSDLGTLDLGDS